MLIVAACVCAPAAIAQTETPTQDIQSDGGPLTDIWIGNDLGCQVAHTGDENDEFYPPDGTPGDCGTFVSVAGTLYGPDFADHGGGSATPFADSNNYEAFTPVSQTSVSGAGTAASPYEVTTVVDAGTTGLQITEVDSYVSGSESYRTDITIANSSRSSQAVILYRGGDCYLQGSDYGYGWVDPHTNAPSCTENAENSPPGQIEQFYPLTGTIGYVETLYYDVWGDIGDQTALPDTCDCTTDEDNAEAIDWAVTVPDGSVTESMETNFSATGQELAPPAVTTGAATGVGQTAATLNGTVNPEGSTITSCVFQWGTSTTYGNDAPCAQSPGSGDSAVAVSAALSSLAPGTTYHYRLVATNGPGTSYGTDQTFTTSQAAVTQTTTQAATTPAPAAPDVVSVATPTASGSTATFSGVVDPDGLQTTASFIYGLDPKYFGGGPIDYDQSTPSVAVGDDFGDHPVSLQVADLIPNAEYHVRLVASNSAGTVEGVDQVFGTLSTAAPPPPVLGRSVDVSLVSGQVFVLFPGSGRLALRADVLQAGAAAVKPGSGFIPLTEARQIPVGSVIDAVAGTLDINVASANHRKSRQARLNGGIFTVRQARTGHQKGQANFVLKESAFRGAPSYASCTSTKTTRLIAGGAVIAKHKAAVSSKVLQTLNVSEKQGGFSTQGRYSVASVRGTVWETQDRCDGTLTFVRSGRVSVLDFHTHKTILLTAGHRFLATP